MSLLMRPLAWPRTVFGRLVAILFAGLVAAALVRQAQRRMPGEPDVATPAVAGVGATA